jgi:hypothetical protein
MKQVTINPISFSPAVRSWTRERFLSTFTPVYPDHDLEAYAKELGLISEPVADEAPAAIPSYVEGGEVPGIMTPSEEPEKDTATSLKPKRGGKK